MENIASENDKGDCSWTKEIAFNLDSFSIGIDIFTNYCMSDKSDYFVQYQLYENNSKGKIKVANGRKIDIKGEGKII